MARTGNVFRVFISSTFSDMGAERAVLQERVFPRLQAFCRDRGGRFQAIDLRWGVSDEAARDRRTMSICLEEIRRCRRISPSLNFLVLLGDRYGWRPLPAEIDADDFDRLCGAAGRRDRERLRGAYRRDDNALRPRYLQAAQTGIDAERVQVAESALQASLRRALAAAFDAKDPRQIAYGASATHLEIAARLDAQAGSAQNVLCYFRRPAPGAATPQPAADRESLARLKRTLVAQRGDENIRRYKPLGGPPGAAADAFAERVEADLQLVILRELRKHGRLPALDRELDEQQRFARERARHVVGREALLGRMRGYLGDDTTEPLVLVGASGSGKSSVMARAALDAAASGAAVVIARFVGATPDTADIERLLRGLCLEIGRAFKDDQPVPFDYHDLEKDFHRRIAAATPARPLHLFVDALDQIDMREAGPLIPWLPRQLPGAVKLVVSVLDDPDPVGDTLRILRGLLLERAFLTLDRLSRTDAGGLLDIWLGESGRTLQPKQRVAVLRAYGRCPLPLFLRVAFEQARLWRSFDRPMALESNVERLAQQFFARLESRGQHGSALMRHSLRYLLAARYGLAEDEMLALLSANAEVLAELLAGSPHSPRVTFLPFVIWSRLRSELAPYLSERAADETAVMTFYHRALGTAAQGLSTDDEAQTAHRHMAAFFAGSSGTAQPHRFRTARAGSTMTNRRKLSELPYQQTSARLWPALVETLTDLSFVQAKCTAGMTGDLVGDYDRALGAIGTRDGSPPDRRAEALADVRSFVQRERSTFEAHAGIDGLVFQQAYNQGGNGTVTEAWKRWRADRSWRGRRWFRIDRAPGDGNPLLATLERHRKGVTDCGFDGGGSLLVSSGMDGAVFAWRTSDWGFSEVVAELTASADSCALSSDGTRVATACADGYVRIHDRRTRATTVCEGKYSLSPRRCRFIRGDEQLVSVGRFGLRIHDTATGRLLRESLRESTLNDCAAGPGTLVTAGDCAETLVVYDTADGSVVRNLYLDVRRVQGAVFSPDGRHLLGTGGTFTKEDDIDAFGETNLWETDTWQELDAHNHRHDHPALNCVFVDQGRFYVVGLQDGTIEVYETATGNRIGAIKGHDSGVRGLALSPDGTCLATAAFDGRLKIWRASGLVSGAAPARAAGRGLFCAIGADGSTGWAFTGRVDHFRCDFAIQRLVFAAPAEAPRALPRSRDLAELTLQRRDPAMPMQACAVELTEMGDRAAHRSSPVTGDGTHWLVHDSARMWPSTFHLLPAIPPGRWSRQNLTWARSSDGRGNAVVRTGLVRVGGKTMRHVALQLFEGQRAKSPIRIFEWDVAIDRAIGQCSYSGDGRTVRLAAGSEIREMPVHGRRTPRTFDDAGAEVRAFCESPTGMAIVGACANGQLCHWDAATGRLERSIPAHTGEAVDCAFIDDREFVSIGADGTLQLWKLGAGEPLAVFVAETGLAAVATNFARRRVLALDTHGRSYFVDVVKERVTGR